MKTALPSNRSFGWTFTAIFILFGAHGLWKDAAAQSWLLAVAAVTALVTLTRDSWLAPFNRAWMALGELLGRVVSPIVLGVIFFGVFTPAGALMRKLGRDAMCRRIDPAAPSYWVEREPPGPAETSFRDLF